MKTLHVNGIDLAVADEGAGPPVVLVHGFPLDHGIWDSQIAALARRYRVIAPDLRGFGHSGVTPGKVTIEQFADDLAAMLDALGRRRAGRAGRAVDGRLRRLPVLRRSIAPGCGRWSCATPARRPIRRRPRPRAVKSADRVEREGPAGAGRDDDAPACSPPRPSRPVGIWSSGCGG